MRRYAAEIYRIQQHHPYVKLSMLAISSGTSLQAASRMIRRLKMAGLLAHERYRGVRLTRDGELIALPAIRRHRLTEVFLVKIMRFGWDEVHELVDALEPGINQLLEDRIDELADHPTRCPHGEPIPSRDGVMPVLNDTNLSVLEPGATGVISRVRTHDRDKLRYLAELGLVPGVEFKLQGSAPFNGALRIHFKEQEHVIGHKLAATLWVELTSNRPSAPMPHQRL